MVLWIVMVLAIMSVLILVLDAARNFEWGRVGVGRLQVVGAVACAASAAAVPIGAHVVWATLPPRVVVTDSDPIVALSNSTRMDGYYSLLGGSIDEEDVFAFVAPRKDGSLSLKKIEAEGVLIREGGGPETARIEETQRCRIVSDTVDFLVGPGCSLPITTVHVPDGAVLRDFVIDPGARGTGYRPDSQANDVDNERFKSKQS